MVQPGNPQISHRLQVYDSVELFAGTGWVTRCMKLAGSKAAALDINLGNALPGKQAAMDLTSPAGMAFLGSYHCSYFC